MNGNRLVVEDSEAQKAVEALLALKSPSHYSSNADEEEYLLLEDHITQDNSIGLNTIPNYGIGKHFTSILNDSKNIQAQKDNFGSEANDQSSVDNHERKFYITNKEKPIQTNLLHIDEEDSHQTKSLEKLSALFLNKDDIPKGANESDAKENSSASCDSSNENSHSSSFSSKSGQEFMETLPSTATLPFHSSIGSQQISKLEQALTGIHPKISSVLKSPIGSTIIVSGEEASSMEDAVAKSPIKDDIYTKNIHIENSNDAHQLINFTSKFCFGIASNKVIDETILSTNGNKEITKNPFQNLSSEIKNTDSKSLLNPFLTSNGSESKNDSQKKLGRTKNALTFTRKKPINPQIGHGKKSSSKGNSLLINKKSHYMRKAERKEKSLLCHGPKESVKGVNSSISKKSGEKSIKSKISKCKQKKGKSRPKNIVKEVINAVAKELSPCQLKKLTPLQACQLSLLIQQEEHCASDAVPDEAAPKSKPLSNATSKLSMTGATFNPTEPFNVKEVESSSRLSIDTDEMLPIQAEVIMSEDSECGADLEPSTRRKGIEEEIQSYLQTFVSTNPLNRLVEYPPKNNEVPQDSSNLTAWQLDEVRLPRFTPLVNPPPWLRLTIPAEGYCCHSCGDTFFIESSLVQHRERRSIWISLECGPCDAKLTFYNRCAFKDHIREHLLRGECVDEETVIVRSLPLQLTKLLQPIRVPVPESLRPAKSSDRTPCAKPYISRSSNDKENVDCNDALSNFGGTNAREIHAASPPSPAPLPLPPEPNRNSSMKLPVRCYLCERMFHNVRELMAHMKTDQPWSDQRVECRKCLLVLPSVCAAKSHILTHPPANSSNISVCPECGSRCDGPRDFVSHLNTCGHQFRRSGIMCIQCHVCFFKITEDFINHWMKEHCSKSYECILCTREFDSPAFHKCDSSNHLVLATFRCLLACPLCNFKIHVNTQDDKHTSIEVKNHLVEAHPTMINRVHYVYKSKFCTNAFHSKDELRAHHDREHRRDNHYRTKTCTLHHEVLSYQHKYFDGQEPRNAFISLSITLSPEEIEEAQTRDVPTVSSVIDKTLFPDGATTIENAKVKIENDNSPSDQENLNPLLEISTKIECDLFENLKPCICYRCGYTYTDAKFFKKHKRSCKGESAERLCQSCGTAGKGEEFAKHCHGHISEGLIICIYCNGSPFLSHKELQQHFYFHTREQFSYPAICAFCSFLMIDEASALSHLNSEHDPNRFSNDLDYECERCGRKFHGERGLNIHLTRCSVGTATPTPMSAAGRQCQVCKKALTPEMFGKHLVSHLEEGLLVCSLCDGLTLPSSMALLHHLEEHSTTLDYPTTCPMCSLELHEAESALTHFKEDHGFGNLSCPECEMIYTFTYQLQRHIDIVHKVCLYAKRRYICWICRAYDHVKKETLMNHFRLIHGLSIEEVDEKATIRTRGQGTMPSSQFIPTKPLGSKEIVLNSLSKADKSDCDPTPKMKSKSEYSQFKLDSQESGIPLETESGKEKSDRGKCRTTMIDESQIKKEKSDSGTEDYYGDNGITTNHYEPSLDTSLCSSPKEKIPEKTTAKNDLLKDSRLDLNEEKKPSNSHRSPKKEIDRKKNKDKNLSAIRRRKKYHCKKCKFGTNTKSKFERHRLRHSRISEGFVCEECGQSFVVEPSLIRHMFFAHKIKKQVPSENTPIDTASNILETCEAKRETKYKKTKSSRSHRSIKTPNSVKQKAEKSAFKDQKELKGQRVEKGEDKTLEEYDASDLQCCVCKEEFETSIQLYSHLRTHGMAFLKLGRSKRNLCQ